MQQPELRGKFERLYRNHVWTLVAAFGTYFCMYGFRKPYTAATYADAVYFGIDYKFLLIIFQTLGYVIAKWIGIKVIAEIKPAARIRMLLILILFAEIMLLFFGMIPRPLNILCLLLNGLALGIVFGLVLGFLEGRKNTEALIAGLCASFIVSDGVSKSAGRMLLDFGISENWMPFFAGLVFAIPMLIFIFMLSKVPPPSKDDILKRSARVPMTAQDRWNFFLKYAPGLTGIMIIYLFVTLLRSIRADFAPELWRDLGFRQTPALFTQSELLVSFGVVIVNGFAIYILNHYKAFRISLFTCLMGFSLLLVSVWGLSRGLDKFPFMVLTGLGIYLPYVAVHTTIFERLIALTREKANVGFLMYIADSVGYTGYIVLMLLKRVTPPGQSILYLFLKLSVFLGITGCVFVLFCNWYFKSKLKSSDQSIIRLSRGQGSHI
jgi:hypothetical protein